MKNNITLSDKTTFKYIFLHRCKDQFYLGLGKSGFEQRRVLLKAFQRVLQEGRE